MASDVSPQPSTNRLEQADRPRFRRLRAVLGNDERRHQILFVMGLLILSLVFVMAFLTYQMQELPLDLWFTQELQEIRFFAFTDLMIAISMPGYATWSPFIVGGSCLLVGLWLGWRDGTYLLAITLVQGLTNHLFKTLIGRSRPADTLVEVFLSNSGYSFPSGHVMFYTVFFGFLFFLGWTRLPRSWGRSLLLLLTGLLVLLIGPSRIYLGAHWLSDVVAGHLVGLLILLFAIEFYAEHIVYTPPALEAPPPSPAQEQPGP